MGNTATLYVANCTKQNHDFVYKVPEARKDQVRMQQIPMGSQAVILKPNTELEVLREIISQHEQYGLIDVKEISGTKTYTGLCYSFDKPIEVDKIMYVAETNDAALNAQGVKLRQDSAAALSNALAQSTDGPAARNIEVEVLEVGKDGRPNGMQETIEVVHGSAKSGSRRERRKIG